MTSSFPFRICCFALVVSAGCSATVADPSALAPARPQGSSGGTTATAAGVGGLCAPCQVDADCGEQGSALCVFEAGAVSGACAPACVDDSDCDPAAACVQTSVGATVCYPQTQTCVGFQPVDGTNTGTASTSTTAAGTSSSTSTSTGTSSGPTTSGGTTGSTGCPGFAAPETPAPCTCAAGHTCAANHCYGGWWCDLSSNQCVAPPGGCGGSSTGTSTTGSATGSTGTGVGPQGGAVGLLHFGLSGDTRPPACEDTANYPTAIIDGIGDAYRAAGVQFALDLGDHMYVCNGSAGIAQQQMQLFMQGVAHYGNTWFMTMGNHECEHSPCLLGSGDANYGAFMSALAPISSRPYYSVDVQTSQGLAVFVFIADNGWDSAQASWLGQILTRADAQARYTIISKHHSEGDTSIAANAQIMQTIRSHKFALLLTGHAHRYQHQTTDNGRDLILGNGGAPLVSGGTFNGYAIVDQLQSGQLRVRVYDLSTGTPQDQWSVGPN